MFQYERLFWRVSAETPKSDYVINSKRLCISKRRRADGEFASRLAQQHQWCNPYWKRSFQYDDCFGRPGVTLIAGQIHLTLFDGLDQLLLLAGDIQ